MHAPAMIIIEIAGQDSFQMTIIQHENTIQAIPPDATNYTFDKRILSRTSRRSEHLFNAHAFNARWNWLP